MKRIWALALSALLLAGCAAPWEPPEDGKLQIVTTLFPYYDLARAIAGDAADVTLLLVPGREAHSFEPTPLDAIRIARANVFVYNGGESEEWVEDMLDAAGENIGAVVRMMDFVDALEEEEIASPERGAKAEEDLEYDEHVWTSPANAALLCDALCGALCEADAANADAYRANCAAYVAEIDALDARFHDLRARAKRNLVVFADRMPLLYFCKAYDLRYCAAFNGCSTDTEPSLATLKYLIDAVAEEGVGVVYTVDLDSRKIAEVVAEADGVGIDTLYSLQTVSRADFDAGETYITLMERNLAALEKGLL